MSEKSYLLRAFEAASETQIRVNVRKAERAAKAVKDFVGSMNNDMDGVLKFELSSDNADPFNMPLSIEKVATGEVIDATLHINQEVLLRENARPSDQTVHKLLSVSFGDDIGDTPPISPGRGYYASLDVESEVKGLQLFIVQRAAAGFEKMHKAEQQVEAFLSTLDAV